MGSENESSERAPGESVKKMSRLEAMLWVVIPIAIAVVLAIVYWPR